MNKKKKFKSLILLQQHLSQRLLHPQLQLQLQPLFHNFNNQLSTTSTTTTSTTSTSTTTTTVYTGPFAEYAGFEGTNQTTLDELVKQLPPLLLQIIETNNISIINGCHQYGASLVGRCPYGVWDPSGTSSDGTKNAEWTLSIWISDRAFSAEFPMMFYFMNHFMHSHIQLGTVQKIQQRYIDKMHEIFWGKNI